MNNSCYKNIERQFQMSKRSYKKNHFSGEGLIGLNTEASQVGLPWILMNDASFTSELY